MIRKAKSKKKKSVEELLEEALVPEEEQPYPVPENWVWVRLGKIVSFIGGGTPSKSEKGFWNGNIPWATVKDIKGIYLRKTIDSITEEGLNNSSSSVASPGELLLITRMSPGKSIITRIQTTINQDLKIVRPRIGILPFFLWMYFTVNMSLIEFLSTGSTVKGIQITKLNKLPFPLPPLKEQKRIVDRVERLLNKIDQAKQLIEEAKQTFELRRAAILDKAFRGELTKKWRATEKCREDALELIIEIRKKMNKSSYEFYQNHQESDLLPKGWCWVKIKDIFSIYGGGTPSKSKHEYWNGDIPWVSPKDMKTQYINQTIDSITQKGVEHSTAKIAGSGSTVMVVRSGILQRILPVAILLKDSAVNQDMKVFDSGICQVNKYLMWYIHGYQQKLLSVYTKSGTTVKSIEFNKFKEHYIPLPPKKELVQIINRLEKLLSRENQTITYLENLENVEKIKSSILSKAFRGELGTNDPTDDSALELLKETLSCN